MSFSNTPQQTTNNPSRSLGLDALRTLAILGMMAAHVSRMIDFDVRPAWCAWILLIEPVIPSLFLLMVGISLTLSLERHRQKAAAAGLVPANSDRTWYLKQARRAVVLWGISFVFYLLEMGPRLPDLLVLSGVLATIAYAILVTGALLLLPFRRGAREGAVGLALLAGGALFWRVQASGIFPLTVGDAPLLPLLPFAFAGALWGLLRRRAVRPLFGLGIAAGVLAVWMIHHYGLNTLFTKPFGRLDAGRDLPAPLFIRGEAKHVGYYNLGVLLSLCCLGLHLAGLSLASLLDRLRAGAAKRTSPLLHGLFALGRHSLEVYILHLSLLAILVVTLGMRPLKTAPQGNFVLVAVYLVSWAWCIGREKIILNEKKLL